MKFSSKNMTGVLLGAVVLAVIMAGGYAAGPVLSRWDSLDDEIQLKKEVLARNRSLILRYKAAGGESAKGMMAADRSKNEEEESAKVLSEIEAISRRSSFLIVNLNPRTPKVRGDHKEISFDLAAEGTPEAFSMFLYGLETSAKMLTIKNFSVSPASGRSGGKIKAALLVTHFL